MVSNINSTYRRLEKDRIHQGDVLLDFQFPHIVYFNGETDVEIISNPYCFVISQDCDLDGAHNLYEVINECPDFNENNPINGNKYLPSIIITPAFLADDVHGGTYLSELGFKMEDKGSKKKSKWKDITKNNNPRYHFIDSFNEYDFPQLVVDFKIFYTLPYDFIFHNYDFYHASLNELFRENLSQRFFNYHSRIGLPTFKEE